MCVVVSENSVERNCGMYGTLWRLGFLFSDADVSTTDHCRGKFGVVDWSELIETEVCCCLLCWSGSDLLDGYWEYLLTLVKSWNNFTIANLNSLNPMIVQIGVGLFRSNVC